ncbi:MAG: hypothetical protein K9L24_00780 [Spirochaetia bacterium]|nr:hypothetical protein [Spirochaetia bacterium]
MTRTLGQLIETIQTRKIKEVIQAGAKKQSGLHELYVEPALETLCKEIISLERKVNDT